MRTTAVASQVVFCLLTFSVYSPYISQNDPLKCKWSDVFPCLNNIHWLFFSLGVKAKVLPRLISPTQPSPLLLVISLILPPTTLPFTHLQVPLAFLVFHRNARHVVRAFGLAGSFAWSSFPSHIVTWLVLTSFGFVTISKGFLGYTTYNWTPSTSWHLMFLFTAWFFPLALNTVCCSLDFFCWLLPLARCDS